MAPRKHRNGRRSAEVAKLNAAFATRTGSSTADDAATLTAGTGTSTVAGGELVPLQLPLDVNTTTVGSSASDPTAPASALAQSVSAGAPPAGSAHPLTRRLYASLRDRSVADKRLVFEAAVRRLGVQCTTAKQEKAYQSVAVFVELHGYVPAAGEWERWRKSADAPKGLLSMTFVRNAFGGWPQVRQAFYEVAPSPDALAHHDLLARGEEYDEAELVNLVRVWAATVEGPLYRYALVAWCVSDAPASLGILRAPAHWNVFGRRFRWEELLGAAGVATRRGTRRRSSPLETQSGVTLSPRRQEQMLTRAFRDAQRIARRELIETRRLVAARERSRPAADRLPGARTGEPAVSRDAGVGPQQRAVRREALLALFERFAGECEGVLMYDQFLAFLAERADEPVTPARGWRAYRDEFSTWDGLLRAAGCWERSRTATVAESRANKPKPPPNAPRASSATPTLVLLRWLRYAAAHFGPTVSYPQYETWRARLLLCAERHGRVMPTIPSSATLTGRCGSWPAAKLEAGVLNAQELADQPDRRSHRPEALIESAWLAMCSHGRFLASAQYEQWRRRRLYQLRSDGVAVVRVPRSALLCTHLGGADSEWEVALDTVWERLTLQQRAAVSSLRLAAAADPGAGHPELPVVSGPEGEAQ